MPGSSRLSQSKRIIRSRDGDREEVDDLLVVEAPLTIFLNGSELVTLLCTPDRLDHLAIGFLRSEGILKSREDITSLRLDAAGGLVEIEVKGAGGLADKLYGKRILTSGCGKGSVFYHALDSLQGKPLKSTLRISAQRLLHLLGDLHQRSALFKETGGVHSAALADSEGIIHFAEDIGRHNALDKIVGACMLEGVDTADKILLSSGRLSSEIVIKTARLGIQILLSRSAPTTLALELSAKTNMTLVGFARGKRINIYNCPERIAFTG